MGSLRFDQIEAVNLCFQAQLLETGIKVIKQKEKKLA